MATDIVIPSIGESVTNGVIVAWSKESGQFVERDETVLELETDKITMEVPAPASGVLTVKAEAGETVEVGAIVGQIDDSAERPAGAPDNGRVRAAETEGQQGPPAPMATGGKERREAERPARAADEFDEADRTRPETVRSTPLARKVAHEHGVDLREVTPTGAGGRIREQDVLSHVQAQQELAAKAAEPTARPFARRPMSTLRQRIATRLVEAQRTAAMLTTFNEVDMSEVMALRKRYKEPFAERYGIGLGFMSFFIRAAVSALRAHPMVNSFIVSDEAGTPYIESHEYCDIAIAVSTPKGLVVPVLRGCEKLSFADIELGIKRLAERARDGKLTLEELQGGTFTITNGGIFGSLMSTPILNPPQSGILGMHAIKGRAVEDPHHPGQVVIRPMMYLALSYDHRIIDGADAVQFLVRIKECIEDPHRLMLEL